MALAARPVGLAAAHRNEGRPATIDALIETVRHEFPSARIRITGRARTVRRQAELMAQRIRSDRAEFLSTYVDRHHIRQMVAWYDDNPGATEGETIENFEEVIRRARASGAVVSNHLSDFARDISWPIGNDVDLAAIEQRIRDLGGSVIRERDAAGGPHWHVDWMNLPDQ